MLTHRIFGLFRLHVILQAVFAGIGFWLWAAVLQWVAYPEGFLVQPYVRYGLVAVTCLIAEAFTRGQGRQGLLDMDRANLLATSVKQLAFVAFGLLAYVVFSKDQTISRTFLGTLMMVLFVLLSISRSLAPHVHQSFQSLT